MHSNRLAVNLIFFVNGFIYANWVARIPGIQTLFEIDKGTLGLLLFSLSSGALLAMPFTGWLIIRNGSHRITIWASIFYCVLVPFISLIPEVWQATVLFFFTGIATGVMDVAMNAQAVLVEKAYRKPIMTSFHAIFSIGMAIGAACGAFFTALSPNLFFHFSAISLPSLLIVIWCIDKLLRDKPHPSKEKETVFRFPNRALIGIGVIAFCSMTGEGAMADWSTSYMLDISQASPILAPIALASFSIAMTTGRIFGDRARVKLGDNQLLIFSSLLATLGLVFSLVFIQPLAVIFGLFLVGIGLATVVPIAYSTAGSSPDLPPGVGLAMVTTIGYSGFLFGPPIIGFLADWSNLRIALFFVAALFVLMTLLSFIRRQHTKVP